jgi:hypothetical protein
MDASEASREVSSADNVDHEDRVQRLLELDSLLPTSEKLIAYAVQAARWLFDDVKATWIYGYFTSTVLTAHAFCSLQLANSIRLLPDDPNLPDEADSLEQLAGFAATHHLIDIELQAGLVVLHDRQCAYTAAPLHEHQLRLERHLVESEIVSNDHALLVDARQALITAVELLRL